MPIFGLFSDRFKSTIQWDIFSRLKNKLYTKLRRTLYLEQIDIKLFQLHGIEIQKYLQENLYQNPRYKENDRLPIYEKQVFSQFGEDGILKEIFNRIGTTNQYFVEFGVETGIETNTTYLLHKDWKGFMDRWESATYGYH
jgi:DNA-directed RNA polymerase specialized sigma54-like protein